MLIFPHSPDRLSTVWQLSFLNGEWTGQERIMRREGREREGARRPPHYALLTGLDRQCSLPSLAKVTLGKPEGTIAADITT